MVHPENGKLFNDKMEWAIKPWKDMKESQMHITKWKRWSEDVSTLWAQLYDILEKGKTIETVKISVVTRGYEEGAMNMWNTEEF